MSPVEIAAIWLSPFTLIGLVVVVRGLIVLARLGSYPLPERRDDASR